jgi:phosphoribosylanthranilate isomerase
MFIKICGITNFEDSLIASENGADALGFVFYEKSPRYIKPEIAREIIEKLNNFGFRNTKKFGLFVEKSANEIIKISQESNISLAQLHWDIDETNYSEIAMPKIRVIRAKNINDINLHKDNIRFIDSYVESFGGVGHRLNLEWFLNRDNSKIILAGGLNSDNLHELQGFGFYGVDVSSGVELYKGKKDRIKVIEFIKNAKNII